MSALNVLLGSSDLEGEKGVALTARTGILSLGTGSSVNSASGTLQLSAPNGGAILNGTISAGTLIGSPGVAPLNSSQFQFRGSIIVRSGWVNIGTIGDTSLTANGGTISVTAVAGGLNLGSSNSSDTIRANGGNVMLLASQSVLGSSTNEFIATSRGNSSSSSSGGGIEIGAGTTVSKLALTAAMKPGTVQGSFATNYIINNPTPNSNSSGVVRSNSVAGMNNINLSSSGANQAVLNLNGGTIDFDAKGSANTIQFDGSTFSVAALRPIGFTAAMPNSNRFILDNFQEGSPGRKEHLDLADILVAGCEDLQVLSTPRRHAAENRRTESADGNNPGSNNLSSGESATIRLNFGEMFIRPLIDISIQSEIGNVHLRKGALLIISREKSGLRAINCGGSKDAVVEAGGTSIRLGAGEEIWLTKEQKAGSEEEETRDGIGRRNIQHHELRSGIHARISDVSLITVLASKAYFKKLRHPSSRSEQRIHNQIVKSACAIQILTRYKGAYRP